MSDTQEIISPSEAGMRVISADAKAAVAGAVMGPGMRRLQLQRQSSRIELDHSGNLKAATIVNFNPVQLRVEDGHINWRVPAATDKIKKGIKVEHGGKEYLASVVTVREPVFVPWMRDVRPPADEGENPTSEFDPKWILPIELADVYRQTYNEAGGNALNMGGVLVFEGDIHAFTKSKNNTIRVPKYAILPNRSRSYYTEDVDATKALAATLTQQKEHCQKMIQQADGYNQDEMEAKNITTVHRIWAQYALDLGWKQMAPPWMNAQLESEESCRGCGKGKKRNDAFFCDCGRPYNAYAAYMAGENVPESYLMALKGKELDDVLREIARREDLKAKFRKSAN